MNNSGLGFISVVRGGIRAREVIVGLGAALQADCIRVFTGYSECGCMQMDSNGYWWGIDTRSCILMIGCLQRNVRISPIHSFSAS